MKTETIDRLFLELSQFTTAKTSREIRLEAELDKARVKYQELWDEVVQLRQQSAK